MKRFSETQEFANSALQSGSRDLSNLSRQFKRNKSKAGPYSRDAIKFEDSNRSILDKDRQKQSINTKKDNQTDESKALLKSKASKETSQDVTNRGLSLYDYYALQQDYKTQSPLESAASAVKSTKTLVTPSVKVQEQDSREKDQIEPNQALVKAQPLAQASDVDDTSPVGSRNIAPAAFKLDSLGATFAFAAPEPNLSKEPQLSVTIRGDSKRTPCLESGPLQALYIDSGSQQVIDNEDVYPQQFDEQNKIVWKAARHNNIEVIGQGQCPSRFLRSPQSGSPRRNNEFLCRQKIRSKTNPRAKSQMCKNTVDSQRQSGRYTAPSRKLMSITQVQNQELKSFENKLKQVNQILGNQKLIRASQVQQVSNNQSKNRNSMIVKNIKNCKCAIEDALISRIKQQSPFRADQEEKVLVVQTVAESKERTPVLRTNNRSVIETLKGGKSGQRTWARSQAIATGQSKPSKASLDGTGSFDYAQDGHRARLDARIPSQEAEKSSGNKRQEPDTAFRPPIEPNSAQGIGIHSSHDVIPQIASVGLGTKSSKTLLGGKNITSENKIKFALSYEEDMVDYAERNPRDSTFMDNTVMQMSKDSAKKTTISFFSKRKLSQTQSQGLSLAAAQMEGDAPGRETVNECLETNLTEPQIDCSSGAPQVHDEINFREEISGQNGQFAIHGEDLDSWKQSNHQLNLGGRPGWVPNSAQSSGPFIRILEKQISNEHGQTRMGKAQEIGQERSGGDSPLQNQRVRTKHDNRETIRRLKQQLKEDDADFTNHEADSNGMVLESIRNYSQRQSEGFTLAGQTAQQDYGFGVAITTVARKSLTPMPQTYQREQWQITEGSSAYQSEQVDPSSLYNQSNGYRANKQRNMAALGNRGLQSQVQDSNIDRSRGSSIGMPSNASLAQQMHVNYLRHKLRDHSKKQQIYSQQQKLMRFSQSRHASERGKGSFCESIPHGSLSSQQKNDFNQSIRQIDIVKKPAGLQNQAKTVLHFFNQESSEDKFKNQKFELGGVALASFDSNYRPSEGNMEATQISYGKKIATEVRSSSALEVDNKRFYYKNEDIEKLSYTPSQVGFGEMKLLSSSKKSREKFHIETTGKKSNINATHINQLKTTELSIQPINQYGVNTQTTERANGAPSPDNEVSAHSSWQMNAKQPFGPNYQFAPDQNGNITYKRIFEMPSRNIDTNLFLFDNSDKQYYRKTGRLFQNKKARPNLQDTQETNPKTSKTTSPQDFSPPRKTKSQHFESETPKKQDDKKNSAGDFDKNQTDVIRSTKVKQKLVGSGDKYFGEYASQQESIVVKDQENNLKINVTQLDSKQGFLPISFRNKEAEGPGQRSSRKPSVHGLPQESQEESNLGTGNRTVGNPVSRLNNPQNGQNPGQENLMNIKQEDSYEENQPNQPQQANGTAERQNTDNDQILSQQTEQLSVGNQNALWLLKNKYDKASSRRSSKLIQNALVSPTGGLSPAFGPYSPMNNHGENQMVVNHSQDNSPSKKNQNLEKKFT